MHAAYSSVACEHAFHKALYLYVSKDESIMRGWMRVQTRET